MGAKKMSLKFRTARLLSAKYQQEFQSNLDDEFEAIERLTGGPQERWNQFKEVVTETAKPVLCPKENLQQNWFDDNDEAVRALLTPLETPEICFLFCFVVVFVFVICFFVFVFVPSLTSGNLICQQTSF